nr:TniB family NTP-binding protein [Acinetobacter sp. 226-4]
MQEFTKKYYTKRIDDIDMQLLSLTKPVILIQAPVKANVKDLYINILDNFFVPYRESDNESKLRNQILLLMRKYETKMLIIDELHNCIIA